MWGCEWRLACGAKRRRVVRRPSSLMVCCVRGAGSPSSAPWRSPRELSEGARRLRVRSVQNQCGVGADRNASREECGVGSALSVDVEVSSRSCGPVRVGRSFTIDKENVSDRLSLSVSGRLRGGRWLEVEGRRLHRTVEGRLDLHRVLLLVIAMRFECGPQSLPLFRWHSVKVLGRDWFQQ